MLYMKRKLHGYEFRKKKKKKNRTRCQLRSRPRPCACNHDKKNRRRHCAHLLRTLVFQEKSEKMTQHVRKQHGLESIKKEPSSDEWR